MNPRQTYQIGTMMKPDRTKNNDFFRPKRMKIQTLGCRLNEKLPARKYLLPGALPDNETVFIIASPGVETQVLSSFFAYVVSAGKNFYPFGTAVAVPVFYCRAAGNQYAGEKRMQRIWARDPFVSSQKRAAKNLTTADRDYEGTAPLYLNSISGQEAFMDSIPPGCKLVIIDGISALLYHGKNGPFDYREINVFCAMLNARGMTVLIFSHETKKVAPVENCHHNVIFLTPDAGAPHEFGGGFNIVRTKFDDDDLVPTKFQFWYKVVDGKFDFGWECREQLDRKAAKYVEITERRMRVEQLLEQGMQQKEIAAELEVDAATISRDVAKLQESKQATTESTKTEDQRDAPGDGKE